jgi:polyhydroxyalkanoate synthesis regulator phasin
MQQLRVATDRLIADGKMTPEEQKTLLRELAQRIADRFAR